MGHLTPLLLLLLPATQARAPGSRDPRFFGLFNIITFPNNVCNGSQELQGVCLSPNECDQRGGEKAATCAAGFGSCCVFVSSLDSMQGGVVSLDSKVGYLQNPSYPQSDSRALMQMVQLMPAKDTVCQLRIDFLEFELDGGSKIDKPCDRDSVTVLGTGGLSLGVGTLCGRNTGQHLYLPVQGARGGPANMRIHTQDRLGDFTPGYKWNIKVTQIDCSSPEDRPLLAPEGCVQYFRESAGTISSFNFQGLSSHQYSPDLNYAICLKRPNSACQVTYKRDPALPAYSTSVGKAQPSDEYSQCGDKADNGCSSTECVLDHKDVDEDKETGDYLLIPGGISSIRKARDEQEFHRGDFYCGAGLGEDSGEEKDGTDSQGEGGPSPGVVSQASGPVVLRFVTDSQPGLKKGDGDADEAQVRDELGWRINYLFATVCSQFVFAQP